MNEESYAVYKGYVDFGTGAEEFCSFCQVNALRMLEEVCQLSQPLQPGQRSTPPARQQQPFPSQHARAAVAHGSQPCHHLHFAFI